MTSSQKERILLVRTHMEFIQKSLQTLDAKLDELVAPYENAITLLCTIPGVDRSSAITILSEIGTNMSQFNSSKRLCCWAGLTPGNNESAGKKKSVRITRMKLEFKNVTKQYGEVNAVNKVNCAMEKGIYGLLGVNGAGKTTLMRMLCTIVQPSEGQILWNGKDIWKLGGEYREVLGYLPQDFGYYPDLTVYDYMMYISSIKGLKMPFARKKVKQLLNQVGMEKFSKRKMKNLSGGMVRRVGIAQAMLNDPQILVLDEPTAGLDPNERIRFRNLISELSEERLVLLSTHIVSDIEYIANNIMLMKDGELFYAGTAEDLVSSMKEKVWQCNVLRNMIDKYMNEYLVGNIKTTKTGAELRIISIEKPTEDAVAVEKNLEDAFLFYFGEKSEEKQDA